MCILFLPRELLYVERFRTINYRLLFAASVAANRRSFPRVEKCSHPCHRPTRVRKPINSRSVPLAPKRLSSRPLTPVTNHRQGTERCCFPTTAARYNCGVSVACRQPCRPTATYPIVTDLCRLPIQPTSNHYHIRRQDRQAVQRPLHAMQPTMIRLSTSDGSRFSDGGL